MALEGQLMALCAPFLDDPSAVPAKLCRRIQRHIRGLFVFVAQPEVPSDDNAAERSLRQPGGQPEDQSRYSLPKGYPQQDDPGFPIRHLARTRHQPSHRLPSTTRFPPSLNSYVPLRGSRLVLVPNFHRYQEAIRGWRARIAKAIAATAAVVAPMRKTSR